VWVLVYDLYIALTALLPSWLSSHFALEAARWKALRVVDISHVQQTAIWDFFKHFNTEAAESVGSVVL